MEKTYYQTIKETVYHEKMANGLNVYLMPKEGFKKTYGLFSTRFGSIDRSFVPLGETEMITVPDGVAHFLEHKMFDMSDGDASEKFAALGASSNAYTSHSRTAYLFNTAENVDACTELLLDFVQELNVTPESIEKEKGIINQEIGMYDDDPDWRGYFGAISNLYHIHPVKIDIAGTVETVSHIDYDILQKCYNTFYHPSNMMLFIIGHFDAEHLMSIIRENQTNKKFHDMPPIIRGDHHEPETINKKNQIEYMDVTMPKVNVSMKINHVPNEPKEKLKKELSFYVFLDMLFSKSSDLRDKWMKQGLINDSFFVNFTQERDFSHIVFSGDSPKPDELVKSIHKLIQDIPHMSLDLKAFERQKRNNIGTIISYFNSLETVASLFSQNYLEGLNLFDLFEGFQTLKIDDIENILPLFCEDLTSDFVIRPLGDKE